MTHRPMPVSTQANRLKDALKVVAAGGNDAGHQRGSEAGGNDEWIGLGTLTVALALLIAAIKSSFVLRIFMHLKFENRMFSLMVLAVFILISAVIIITLIDYIYR